MHEPTSLGLPTPRYTRGQKVWLAYTAPQISHLPCPECHRTGTWKVLTPAGNEYQAECLRCHGGTVRTPLHVTLHEPATRELTVDKITVSNVSDDWGAQSAGGGSVKYMCKETGSPMGGSVYRESDFFPTQAEALEVAQAKAAQQNAGERKRPSDQAARGLAHLTLSDAVVREALYRRSQASYIIQRIQELITDQHSYEADVEGFRDRDEILEDLETLLKYNPIVQELKASAEKADIS